MNLATFSPPVQQQAGDLVQQIDQIPTSYHMLPIETHTPINRNTSVWLIAIEGLNAALKLMSNVNQVLSTCKQDILSTSARV